jgi:hypothetical protein
LFDTLVFNYFLGDNSSFKKKKKKNLFLGLFLLFQLCFMETIWFSFWDSVANSIAVDPGF